jgi:hypothetical protein
MNEAGSNFDLTWRRRFPVTGVHDHLQLRQERSGRRSVQSTEYGIGRRVVEITVQSTEYRIA